MSRLIHLLALIALGLAPAAMHGAPATAAAPHHETAAGAHCAGGEQGSEDDQRGRSADCAIACSAMPCGSAQPGPVTLAPGAYGAAPVRFFAGTAPGSDPPPPRSA